MRQRHLFHRIWLFLGLAQLGLAAGCHAGGAADWLLSSTSPLAEAQGNASAARDSHDLAP
jgi:hypothetical protein